MDNVDQIRQLILGEQLQNYDQELKKLQQDLQTIRADLEQFLSAFTKELEGMRQQRSGSVASIEKMLDQNRDSLRKQLSEAEKELRKMAHQIEDSGTNRHDLADLLIELGKQLGTDSGK